MVLPISRYEKLNGIDVIKALVEKRIESDPDSFLSDKISVRYDNIQKLLSQLITVYPSIKVCFDSKNKVVHFIVNQDKMIYSFTITENSISDFKKE